MRMIFKMREKRKSRGMKMRKMKLENVFMNLFLRLLKLMMLNYKLVYK